MSKIVIIDNNSPYEEDRVGGICQEMVFTLEGSRQRYRIKIFCEHNEKQSYATLEAWTSIGFSKITKKNPKRHYGIEAAKHRDNIPADLFSPIIRDLAETAFRFENGFDTEAAIRIEGGFDIKKTRKGEPLHVR